MDLLNEEWYEGIKSRFDGKDYDIFLNPNHRDFREFKGKAIRFIAVSKSKDLYVFPANVLHFEVGEALGRADKDRNWWGVGISSSGRYSARVSDEFSPRREAELNGSPLKNYVMKEIYQGKYDWLDRYIDISYIKDMITYLVDEVDESNLSIIDRVNKGCY